LLRKFFFYKTEYFVGTFYCRIGVTEKGYATLELMVSQTPGHSSFPPRHSAIGILAAAIARIENKQQPNLFGKGPEFAMFQHLLPDVGVPSTDNSVKLLQILCNSVGSIL
jgi:acetylornithine deacetylase/succinyl-diaminopimelate desuccinylase-like protein